MVFKVVASGFDLYKSCLDSFSMQGFVLVMCVFQNCIPFAVFEV